MQPTKEEVSRALKANFVLVAILEKIVNTLEQTNKGDNRWFIYSEKVARKYLNQALTLQYMFKDDIYRIRNGKEEKFIDFSSTFSLVRVLLETYAVFHHLFIDNCKMEEKILRFRLWELDGLREVIKQVPIEDTERIVEMEKQVDECVRNTKSLIYFNSFTPDLQEYLLSHAAWSFTEHTLVNSRDKRKKKLSKEGLIAKTGLGGKSFDNWYSFTSIHAHTNYWSVVQNDSLTREQRELTEYVAIMQVDSLTACFIEDFTKIYESAKNVFDNLSEADQKLITALVKDAKQMSSQKK